MFERRELRSRREERNLNGVKNLKGARLFPKTFSNNGNGDASICLFTFRRLEFILTEAKSFDEKPKHGTKKNNSNICPRFLSE